MFDWMVSLVQSLFRKYYVCFSYSLIGLFFVLLTFNTVTYFFVVYPRTFGLTVSLKSCLTTGLGVFLLTVILGCYLKAMLTNPGHPRSAYPDMSTNAEEYGAAFCTKCNYFKPPNAHHCSMCKVCVMDMDHHCPWLNTCIGSYNQRFFFQFLVWATLGCLFMVLLEATEVYGILFRDFKIFRHYTPITRFLMLFSFMSSLALVIALGIFAGFHAYLILTETSTLDVLRGDRKRSLAASNWVRVFGRRPIEWLLPCELPNSNKLF